MVSRAHAIALTLGLLLSGCGLEPLISQPLSGADIPDLPPAEPSVVKGRATALPGGDVELWSSGAQLGDYSTTAGPNGSFTLSLPGNTELSGLRVVVTLGRRAVWGLLPPIPKRQSVLDPFETFEMGKILPEMSDLNAETTLISLVLTRLAKGAPLTKDALASGSSGIAKQLAAGNDVFTTLLAMVKRLIETAPATGQGTPPFLSSYLGTPGATALDEAFLSEVAVDYDDDGAVDVTTDAFDAALEAAAADPSIKEGVEQATCYPDNAIRVVFQVDMRPGALDLNCKEINTFKWAKESASSKVYITGGIHEDTPLCGPDRASSCLTKEQFNAANQLLGDWNPNQVVMYDDGSHGDAIAGDGIWTLTVALPYIPTSKSPDGKGVRIGYKYTFGSAKQGWTDSEEWPGNRRILELEDTNDDHLVVRFDAFGDETTNKDKKNALTPKNGGCGVNKWETDKTEACGHDTRENLVDTNQDCKPDAPPPTGTASPLTCDEAKALGY